MPKKRKAPKTIVLDGDLLRKYGVKRIVRERVVEEFGDLHDGRGHRLLRRDIERETLPIEYE